MERYGTVLNLEMGGTFADLTPLAGLTNVTYLKLEGEQFGDLRPLAQLPNQRELVLVRERPLDLAPLTDAPHLRQVSFERCAFMRMEVAALKAGLPPEADDFLAVDPRPLGPLKFYLASKTNETAKDHFARRAREVTELRAKFYEGDVALERAEARSFLSALHADLNALLGRGWGLVQFIDASNAGRTFLSIKRYQIRRASGRSCSCCASARRGRVSHGFSISWRSRTATCRTSWKS